MKKIIIQFLPIVLIFLFLSKNSDFIEFSKTVPGKLLATLIIIFCISVDKTIGLFSCAVILLYYHLLYQSTFKEPMEIIDSDIANTTTAVLTTQIEYSNDNDFVDDYVYIEEDTPKNKSRPQPINIISMKPLHHYSSDGSPEGEFRKNNCYDGHLTIKDIKVKNEMAEHVYPELKYKNVLCNPCSKNCDISVTQEKFKAEDKVKPVYTKTLFVS